MSKWHSNSDVRAKDIVFWSLSVCDDRYLYGGAGWVLHLCKSVSFLLEFVHLALVGQQAVVLKVLMESKSK